MSVHVGERVGPFVVVANESTCPARKRRVVVRCVACERVSEMNERSLLDKRTEEQRACAKCRVYTTNGTWTKGWRAKMENAAAEANRLNEENARLRDEIDKVMRERDEARAAEEHLRGQHQYSIGLSMALEERDQARRERDQEREACAMYAERSARFAEQADRLQRERDLALGRLENEIKAANQARMAEERARESLDELDAAIYECLPSDYDDDSPLDCVEHAADRLRELAEERDEARAEAEAAAARAETVQRLDELNMAREYRRGAEAMREACAKALMADGLVLSRERAAKVVRALPIPEET